jgi:Bacteriophage holin family
MIQQWVSTFAHDGKVQAAVFLVIVDLLLGVSAAIKNGTFKFNYLMDFAKQDILGKLIPYFALYVISLVAGNTDIVIPGLDFGFFAGTAYVALVAAMSASILGSLSDLGITTKLQEKLNPRANLALFAADPRTPEPPATPDPMTVPPTK